MKLNLSIVIIIIFVLFSCSNQTVEKKEPETKKDSVTKPFSLLTDHPSIVADPNAPADIPMDKLPGDIKYKGSFYQAWQWQDKTGKNLLLLSTYTINIPPKDIGGDEKSGELFAKQYIFKEGEKPNVLWEMYDSRLKCPFDLVCNFITSQISDVDNDSIWESTIIYRMACVSDVSSSTMKLIMHEGKQKYALRGLMIFKIRDMSDSLFTEPREADLSKISADELARIPYRNWGCFENANDFKNAPPSFLEYAIQLWKDNSVE